MKRILTFLALVSLLFSAFAIEPKTYEFAVIDGDTLRMDIYMPSDSCTSRTAVIFAFGGAFRGGARNEPHYTGYLRFLAENGIVAISTDYRTTLLKNPSLLTSPEGVAQAFTLAITDAVSDFYTATYYVLQNAVEFGIDPSKIIASGSSAGAITALQAEYGICNGASANIFPAGFNYAGVISFAGAIFTEGGMTWGNKSCPMQLFHGDFDHNVPYSEISAGPVSLNGSELIAKALAKQAVACEFYTFVGVDHKIALSPMTDNLYEILAFIKRISSGKPLLTINAVENIPGVPIGPVKKITMEDLIKANL